MSVLRALAVAAFAFATPVAAKPPVVFAAASLKTALDAVASDFVGTGAEAPVISYAGSSALARQIAEGAPADIFISASTDWMDDLDRKGLIQTESREDLLGNRLVLVAGQATPALEIAALPTALGDGRLAMALVDSVPAGVYGKAALTHLGLWDALSRAWPSPENVRTALALVSRGEAPYGIVYASDAVADPAIHVVATFPEDSHPPITYPAALTKTSDNPAAQAFLDYLSTPEAAARFEAQGFSLK